MVNGSSCNAEYKRKWNNIKDIVAHAFYIPQDYGITYAALVSLCVLRLAKFRPGCNN